MVVVLVLDFVETVVVVSGSAVVVVRSRIVVVSRSEEVESSVGVSDSEVAAACASSVVVLSAASVAVASVVRVAVAVFEGIETDGTDLVTVAGSAAAPVPPVAPILRRTRPGTRWRARPAAIAPFSDEAIASDHMSPPSASRHPHRMNRLPALATRTQPVHRDHYFCPVGVKCQDRARCRRPTHQLLASARRSGGCWR